MTMRIFTYVFRHIGVPTLAAVIIATALGWDAAAQNPPAPAASAPASAAPTAPPATAPAAPAPSAPSTLDAKGATLPADYVIGPSDVLSVRYWREDAMSAPAVTVRPDGMISLPLVNDVQAAGLTPEALRQRIAEAAARYVESPVVSVIVTEIKSRKVFITGMVGKAGEYPLVGPTTVLQLIAIAGGLQEFADAENISVIRNTEKDARGQPRSFRVNYKDLTKRRNLAQNIELKPGDTIVVP
jgi:polysaccharide export outer membrane protein